MYVVTLINWRSGFVANRLIRLLREYGHSLSGAHRIAAELTAGESVAVQFPDRNSADRFADAARSLGVDVAAARVADVA
jgi:hypothetical protein